MNAPPEHEQPRQCPRKPFTRPELLVYGDVRALTNALGMGRRGDGLPGGPAKTG